MTKEQEISKEPDERRVFRVKLRGSESAVWFAVSRQRLMAGPFTSHDDAWGNFQTLRHKELAFTTVLRSNFPDETTAELVEDSKRVQDMTTWSMALASGQVLYFNMTLNGPVAGTFHSASVAFDTLSKLSERAKLWIS